MAFTFNDLQAGGVIIFIRCMIGNYHLGHPSFCLVYGELNRRKTVLFIHSTDPAHRVLSQPVLDYQHKTTYTALDLTPSGTKHDFQIARFPCLKAAGRSFSLLRAVELVSPLLGLQNLSPRPASSTSTEAFDPLLKHLPNNRIMFATELLYAPAGAAVKSQPNGW